MEEPQLMQQSWYLAGSTVIPGLMIVEGCRHCALVLQERRAAEEDQPSLLPHCTTHQMQERGLMGGSSSPMAFLPLQGPL